MRLNKSIVTILVSFVLLYQSAGLCSAASPEKVAVLNDLIEKAAVFDQQSIEIEGEVIGDVLQQGDRVWINICDGNTTISAWGDKQLGTAVKNTGDYKHRGDKVRAAGIFSREDKTQGGELCLHMADLSIVEKGGPVTYCADYTRVTRTIISVMAALLFYVIYRRRQNFNR